MNSMGFRQRIVLCATLALSTGALTAQDWDDWDEYDEGYVSARKGIEFALNFGVYQGHHKAANEFFSGYSGEIYELNDNTANLMTIEERLGISSPSSIVWSQVMNSIGLEQGEFKRIEYPAYERGIEAIRHALQAGYHYGVADHVVFESRKCLHVAHRCNQWTQIRRSLEHGDQ